MTSVFTSISSAKITVDDRSARRVEIVFSGPLQILSSEDAKRLGRALIKAGKFAEKGAKP